MVISRKFTASGTKKMIDHDDLDAGGPAWEDDTMGGVWHLVC